MDDPIFIPIEQLEQKGGKPAEFSKVVQGMKAGKTGHLTIERARKGLGKVRLIMVCVREATPCKSTGNVNGSGGISIIT